MSEALPQPETDFLKLSPWEFDQTNKGWRQLQEKGKFIEAATLIADYIETNKDRITHPNNNEKTVGLPLLNFHRGQMLAVTGQEHWGEAIASFEEAYQDDECWNAYVLATIGFLEGNKEKIEEALRTIRSSQQEEKRSGNIGIVKNFKKALEEGVRDYGAPYSWPKEEE